MEEYTTFATIFCLSLVGLAVALIRQHIKYRYEYWERRGIPHLKPCIPRGNMKEWMRTKHSSEIFDDIYRKYKYRGHLFAGFYFNTQKALVVLDLELIRCILKESNAFQDRGLFHNEKSDPLTGNLFLLDGPKWRSMRSKLTPIFSANKIKNIFNSVRELADCLQLAFQEKLADNGRGVFDVTCILNRFSCDFIANLVFGVDCESLSDPSTKFYVMTRKFFSKRRNSVLVDSLIYSFPEMAKFLRMKVIPEDVTNYFLTIIKKTLFVRAHYEEKQIDFLDLLINQNRRLDMKDEGLTDEEVAAQAFSFFITAFDTCSSTVSCALFELARRQDIQQKLREENNRVLRAHDQTLSYECLKDMKYMDQVISETLRKYPATPSLFRKCTKEYVPLHKPHYHIDKGCTVIIPVLSIHNDSRYYPNPYDFNPDRFSPDSPELPPCAYLPFGDGPRNCIGKRLALMQIGIALFRLIKEFRFDVCTDTIMPIELAIPTFNLVPTSVVLRVNKI